MQKCYVENWHHLVELQQVLGKGVPKARTGALPRFLLLELFLPEEFAEHPRLFGIILVALAAILFSNAFKGDLNVITAS